VHFGRFAYFLWFYFFINVHFVEYYLTILFDIDIRIFIRYHFDITYNKEEF